MSARIGPADDVYQSTQVQPGMGGTVALYAVAMLVGFTRIWRHCDQD